MTGYYPQPIATLDFASLQLGAARIITPWFNNVQHFADKIEVSFHHDGAQPLLLHIAETRAGTLTLKDDKMPDSDVSGRSKICPKKSIRRLQVAVGSLRPILLEACEPEICPFFSCKATS